MFWIIHWVNRCLANKTELKISSFLRFKLKRQKVDFGVSVKDITVAPPQLSGTGPVMWQQRTMLLWQIRSTLQKERFSSATPSSCTFLSSIIELCNYSAQNCMHCETEYMGLGQNWVVSSGPNLSSKLNAINHNTPTVHRQFCLLSTILNSSIWSFWNFPHHIYTYSVAITQL